MGIETAAMALIAASGVLDAYSILRQGSQQQAWADYQAKQARADANAQYAAARVQAEQIRKLARQQASTANAALAGSGVDLASSNALNINADIYRDSEQDAVTTLLSGKAQQQRGYADAQGYQIQGQQAKQASYINAPSSLLLAGGNAATGWVKMKNKGQ